MIPRWERGAVGSRRGENTFLFLFLPPPLLSIFTCFQNGGPTPSNCNKFPKKRLRAIVRGIQLARNFLSRTLAHTQSEIFRSLLKAAKVVLPEA